MQHSMSYKGYVGSVEYDRGEKTFHGGMLHGRILGLPEDIRFEAANIEDFTAAFRLAVDAWINRECKDGGAYRAEEKKKGPDAL